MSEEDNLDWFPELSDTEQKGYNEHNRESAYYISMDEKENAIDSLETAFSFLDLKII